MKKSTVKKRLDINNSNNKMEYSEHLSEQEFGVVAIRIEVIKD